jgi:hypothetical protein
MPDETQLLLGGLVVLPIAVVIHSVMSQMLYGGLFVAVPAPADWLRRGAGMSLSFKHETGMIGSR